MKTFNDPTSLKADTDRELRKAVTGATVYCPTAAYRCNCGFETRDAQVIFAHVGACRCVDCGQVGDRCRCDGADHSDLDGGTADGRDYT